MKKTLYILIIIQIFSCSEITKKQDSLNSTKENQKVQKQKMNSEKDTEITLKEKRFNEFLKSIKIYKILPVHTLETENNISQQENYKIGNNNIQIFKKDSFNINYIKINSNKFLIENLKTINNPTDGDNKKMFCNSLQNGKLYNFNSNDVILLEFTSHPNTGLGGSVTDYLIYDVKNNQLSLFENFRGADFDFYIFPFSKKLNYISSDFKGDFQGATPMHFISKIYSLNDNGKFQLEKDSNGKEYFYESVTFPNDLKKEFEYKWNWF
jgi:hypothetical protein